MLEGFLDYHMHGAITHTATQKCSNQLYLQWQDVFILNLYRYFSLKRGALYFVQKPLAQSNYRTSTTRITLQRNRQTLFYSDRGYTLCFQDGAFQEKPGAPDTCGLFLSHSCVVCRSTRTRLPSVYSCVHSVWPGTDAKSNETGFHVEFLTIVLYDVFITLPLSSANCLQTWCCRRRQYFSPKWEWLASPIMYRSLSHWRHCHFWEAAQLRRW